MMASLLYYQKFRKSLELEGYESNHYEPCITNKVIKNKQITICFHDDDYKLSHKSPKVVGKKIEWLRQEYESISKDGSREISVNRGKINKYLGMNLDYTVSEIDRIIIL